MKDPFCLVMTIFDTNNEHNTKLVDLDLGLMGLYQIRVNMN